ncbi:MAG: hypothetical protein CSA52_01175 [Gammaproteobacteria bacterium]|nr:MAG: hypothetical protein CSB48_13085 [Pseudomonadota bacterium]PIE38792.1 MAG: hypothetical protein CSA52_01175 [Gammaproteobacteria bacterium]
MKYQLLFPVALSVFSLCASGAQPSFKLSVGGFVSEGDYGLSRNTDIVAIPVSVRYRAWPWKVKVSSTLVHLNGPGTLTDGDVGNGRHGAVRDEVGSGDTSFLLEREGMLGKSAQAYWNLGLRVKVPTGSEEKGLGTGEFDYEPRFTLMYLKSSVKPYLLARYTIKGDSDSRRFENTLGATLGIDYKIGGKAWEAFGIGAQLTARESSIKGGNERMEVLLVGRYKANKNRAYSAYVIRGLAEGSPDWAAGFSVDYKWNP